MSEECIEEEEKWFSRLFKYLYYCSLKSGKVLEQLHTRVNCDIFKLYLWSKYKHRALQKHFYEDILIPNVFINVENII